MLKKASKTLFVAMLVFALVGSFTTAFAAPPPDKADKNQACQHASDEGKANASSSSVLGDCAPPPPPAPASTPPADDPVVEDPCMDPAYFGAHVEECTGG